MICPLCGKGKMQEKREGLFWKCEDCSAMLIAKPEEDSAEGLWQAEQTYKHMLTKKGGCSKSGGNRMNRKKPTKRTPAHFIE